ncbi:MAG: TonB-dependent receptor [Bacteroidia bacterium]|nr:MAG: TonB-dependent receptor [Bacteroidia bacterium]
MKNIIIPLFLFLFVFTNQARAVEQQRPATDANVFGHIINTETGEHIPFINILVEGTRIGTITDASGHYLLTNLPPGEHRLIVQGLGFETTYKSFVAVKDVSIEVDVEIRPTAIDLAEVVFTSSPTRSGFRYQPDQAFLGEALQRRSEASFGEMLNSELGVNMRSLGSAPSRPVIRGLDGDRILVLQNGERMGDVSETAADHSISLDPLAASRVEVVRGPASLLYGSSALGGVINLITTDIPEDWDMGVSGILSAQGATVNDMAAGFGRFTYGNENRAATARFSMRQSGNINTPEGIITSTSMSNYDGSAGMGFTGDGLNGGFSASFTGQNYQIPESMEEDEKIEIRMQRQGLQGNLYRQREGLFDRAQLRFNASRMFQQEIEMELEEDGSWDEDVELEYEKYTFSSTLTLQHRPVGSLDRGAIGFNLYGHHMDVGGDEAFTPGERRITIALFTFQEVPLTNRFRLQGGLRLDYQNTAAIANELFPDINISRHALNYSSSIGLNFRPFQGMEIGGQFARSHRNPAIDELFADGPHLGAGVYEIGDPDLRDEIGQGVDLFMNYKNEKIQFEIAGYVNHFYNFIIFQPTGQTDEGSGYPIFRYEGDEARLVGGEIGFGYTPTEKLSLGLGADYVNGRRNGNGDDYLPFIPPFRVMANAEYDFGSFWLGGRVQLVSKQDRVAPEEEVTKGYTIVGAQAGYRLDFSGRHVIILRADNILNEAYRDHLSRIEDRNIVMPGRNFNLAYRWYF